MPSAKYATEFPDFDTLPEIPAHWVDTSWHNDTCPSFSATPQALAGTGISVWVDYADPAKREFTLEESPHRFAAYMTDVAGETRPLDMSSDSWAEVLAWVEATLPKWEALVEEQQREIRKADRLGELTTFLNGLSGPETSDAILENIYAAGQAIAGSEHELLTLWMADPATTHAEKTFGAAWNAAYERMHAVQA